MRPLVTEHRAEARRCPSCGTETKALFPAHVTAPGAYGPGLRARAAYLHKYQLIPLARTSEALRDLFGCSVSPGTVHRMTEECSEARAEVEARSKDSLTAADRLVARAARLNPPAPRASSPPKSVPRAEAAFQGQPLALTR